MYFKYFLYNLFILINKYLVNLLALFCVCVVNVGKSVKGKYLKNNNNKRSIASLENKIKENISLTVGEFYLLQLCNRNFRKWNFVLSFWCRLLFDTFAFAQLHLKSSFLLITKFLINSFTVHVTFPFSLFKTDIDNMYHCNFYIALSINNNFLKFLISMTIYYTITFKLRTCFF